MNKKCLINKKTNKKVNKQVYNNINNKTYIKWLSLLNYII